MKTFTDFLSPFKQWLSLLFAFLFLGTTLFWVSWLYFKSKSDVELLLQEKFKQHHELQRQLVGLKRKELDALAQGLVASPVFKSAIATGDEKTIADVLDSTRDKNNLDALAILSGKKLKFVSSKDAREDLKSLVAARWIGRAGLELKGQDDLGLILTKKIDEHDLLFWENISSAGIAFFDAEESVLISSNGVMESLVNPSERTSQISVTRDGRFYVSCQVIMGESARVCTLQDRPALWRPFNRLKNKLIILGSLLGLAGLILGPLMAWVFSRQLESYLQHHNMISGDASATILEQIELLQKRQQQLSEKA